MVRRINKEADPDIVEEWKWQNRRHPGIPVWSHNGGVCTGEAYDDHIKMTFFKGASLKDPSRLFNQEGTVRRAINIREGDQVNESALKDLIRAAVTLGLKGRKHLA